MSLQIGVNEFSYEAFDVGDAVKEGLEPQLDPVGEQLTIRVAT